MALHPEVKKFLASLPKPQPGEKVTPEGQRSILNVPFTPPEKRMPVFKVEDRVIPGDPHDIPVRIYTPKPEGPFPILMFFHGGGFIAGSIESHDEIARQLAAHSGWKVVSVGYRLAPEHPFPAGLLDCYEATKWAANHRDELDGVGGNLAVCGDSAGGNLAAAVALMARTRKEFQLTKQILFYPSLDLDVAEFRYPSLIENAKGFGLESGQLADYYAHYLPEGTSPNDPLVSPIKEDDLSNLPAALIITAECDPLRDEGECFAEKLRKSGVYVEKKRYEGVIHGFLDKFAHLEEYRDAYLQAAAFLNRQL
jgi:alpha/beta hydrolase fold.